MLSRLVVSELEKSFGEIGSVRREKAELLVLLAEAAQRFEVTFRRDRVPVCLARVLSSMRRPDVIALLRFSRVITRKTFIALR